jgi:hypothetical protein
LTYLLAMNDQDKDIEVLVLRHQFTIPQHQLSLKGATSLLPLQVLGKRCGFL